MPNQPITHYCTISDRNYLPLAMTLAQSLNEHSTSHKLWVLCIDDWSYQSLSTIDSIHNVRPITLQALENEQLLSIKDSRQLNEYCWTVKPFLAQYLFAQQPDMSDATYLDSDLIFFHDPALIFEDFRSRRNTSIWLSHHNFSRRYRRGVKFGRVCGQMYSVKNTSEVHRFLHWWQNKCITRCDSEITPTTFADQKYLDFIPAEIKPHVGYLRETSTITGPWNIAGICRGKPQDWFPVAYHAHGLRVYADHTVKCYSGYRLRACSRLYVSYLTMLKRSLTLLESHAAPCITQNAPTLTTREQIYRMLGMAQWASLASPEWNSSL
jgi:hypothetical protein